MAHSIGLAWCSPLSTPNSLFYVVMYKSAEGKAWEQATTTKCRVTLEGLMPNQLYCFTVHTYNQDGECQCPKLPRVTARTAESDFTGRRLSMKLHPQR